MRWVCRAPNRDPLRWAKRRAFLNQENFKFRLPINFQNFKFDFTAIQTPSHVSTGKIENHWSTKKQQADKMIPLERKRDGRMEKRGTARWARADSSPTVVQLN